MTDDTCYCPYCEEQLPGFEFYWQQCTGCDSPVNEDETISFDDLPPMHMWSFGEWVLR